jgi:hypothetical protein
VLVGGAPIPAGRADVIRIRVMDSVPGIEIVSDFDPPPGGLWLWVACDAVAHAHSVLSELAAL